MNLSEIKKYLLHTFKSEADLVSAIELISYNFTQDRDKISNYVSNDRLVSAYTYFYLSTNLPKLESSLNYIKKKFSDFEEFEIIDIGSGPGTFILGFLEHLPQNIYFAVESSDLMRKQGRELVGGIFPDAKVVFTSRTKEVPKKTKKRLGLFSHSANEMSVAQVESYVEELDLDEVLFIEPGTKEFFKKSLEIRKSLLKGKFNIHYPCPSNANCPMEDKDWCHQFIKITHAADVQRLCQLVKKDRSLLPLTIQYYSKEEKILTPVNRVTRTFKPTKFSIEMQLCQLEDEVDGVSNKLIHFQQLTRNLKKKEAKSISNTYSGEEIFFEISKILPDGIVRGEINEQS